jgi:hypothetical protein
VPVPVPVLRLGTGGPRPPGPTVGPPTGVCGSTIPGSRWSPWSCCQSPAPASCSMPVRTAASRMHACTKTVTNAKRARRDTQAGHPRATNRWGRVYTAPPRLQLMRFMEAAWAALRHAGGSPTGQAVPKRRAGAAWRADPQAASRGRGLGALGHDGGGSPGAAPAGSRLGQPKATNGRTVQVGRGAGV